MRKKKYSQEVFDEEPLNENFHAFYMENNFLTTKF